MLNKDKGCKLCLLKLKLFAEYGLLATLGALWNAWLDKVVFTVNYPGSEECLLCKDVKLLWEANENSWNIKQVFQNVLAPNKWSVHTEKLDLLECVWSSKVAAWPRWSSSPDTKTQAYCWLGYIHTFFFLPQSICKWTSCDSYLLPPKNTPWIFKEGAHEALCDLWQLSAVSTDSVSPLNCLKAAVP